MLLPLQQQQQQQAEKISAGKASRAGRSSSDLRHQQQQEEDGGDFPSDRALARIRGQWQALLQVLSRSLVSCLAICHSERARTAAAAAGGGQLADSAVAALAAGSRSLLGPTAAATVANAAGASAMPSASAAAEGGLNDWGEGREVGTVAWDMASINMLLLALRLVEAVPREWCTRAAVPPVVANAAVVAALDEAVAWKSPQLRPAAARVLELLRPDALLLLQQAESIHKAIAAGEEVVAAVGNLATLLSQQQQGLGGEGRDKVAAGVAVEDWLSLLEAAIPGLGFSHAADVRLLQSALQGLSLCSKAAVGGGQRGTGVVAAMPALAAAASAAAAGWGPVCGQLLIRLLSHEQTSVQRLIYQLLASALEADTTTTSSSRSHGAKRSSTAVGTAAAADRVVAVVQLLCQPLVLEYLVVEGLGSSSTRAAAVAVLEGLLLHGSTQQAVASAAVHWAGWVSCYQGDATAGPLVEAWQVAAEQAGDDSSSASSGWQQVEGQIRRLFSCQAGVRRQAGKQLLGEIGGLPAHEMQQQQQDEWSFTLGGFQSNKSTPSRPGKRNEGGKELEDPFRGLLESGISNASRHKSLCMLTDCSMHLARRFSPSDVRNLLGVVHNQGLAQELRRAAVEELQHLVVVPELREMLLEEWQLKGLWDIVVPQW
jgi:hypothetical protein